MHCPQAGQIIFAIWPEVAKRTGEVQEKSSRCAHDAPCHVTGLLLVWNFGIFAAVPPYCARRCAGQLADANQSLALKESQCAASERKVTEVESEMRVMLQVPPPFDLLELVRLFLFCVI